jgi:hypothetical protein
MKWKLQAQIMEYLEVAANYISMPGGGINREGVAGQAAQSFTKGLVRKYSRLFSINAENKGQHCGGICQNGFYHKVFPETTICFEICYASFSGVF